MPAVRYRRVGRSGIEVSAVGLGSWLTYGASVDEEGTKAVVQRAHDLGVNLFDTANEYAQGAAEELLGKALAPLPRNSLVVATKVYWPMGDGPNDWGLSRKHITEQVHASMDRLGVDYIDIYQCHRFDRTTPLEETCRTMDDLVRSGKILYWGVSEWTPDQITDAVSISRAAGWDPPISNEAQYSALWRPIERDIMSSSAEQGLGILAWSPLAMGILTGKYTDVDSVPPGSRGAGPSFAFIGEDDTWNDIPYFNQPTLDAVQHLRRVAEEAGCSLAQLALAWALRRPEISSVIVGASRPAQLEENVLAADLDIESSLLEAASEVLHDVAVYDADVAPGMD
jgi:voltage-dependent potassium channel beta subunit